MFFKKTRKQNKEKVVWRDKNGKVACPGPPGCPHGCEDSCPIFHNSEGLHYLRMNLPQEAIAPFQRAVEIAPDFHEFYNNLGAAYGMSDQHQKAYEAFSKALELKKDSDKAVHGLMLASFRTGRYDEALQWCEEYERITGKSAQDYRDQIKMYVSQLGK